MPLTQLSVDDGSYKSDGLVLYAWDGLERVKAFIGRMRGVQPPATLRGCPFLGHRRRRRCSMLTTLRINRLRSSVQSIR